MGGGGESEGEVGGGENEGEVGGSERGERGPSRDLKKYCNNPSQTVTSSPSTGCFRYKYT